MTSRALVIGCGGTIGGAWTVAALRALREQTGVEPGDLEILQGTSAGAEIVTMLGGGARVDDLVDMHREIGDDPRLRRHLADVPAALPPLPILRPARTVLHAGQGHSAIAGFAPRGREDALWLQRLAEAFVDADGRFSHPDVRMIAYDIERARRVVLRAPEVQVGTALRASWAIPGWMPPVSIHGRLHVDGGASSTASVDLLPDDVDLAYVIAPMASRVGHRVPGVTGILENALLRRPMSTVLFREIDRVRARGTRVIPILPSTADLAGLGSHFMNRRHRRAAFESAMATASRTVERALRADEPDVTTSRPWA